MQKMKPSVNIFWFRRDIRLDDNAGLYHALKDGLPVLPVFIFDRNILDKLEEKRDGRVEFIHQALTAMQQKLVDRGASLKVFYGFPEKIFADILHDYSIQKVFTNHDYESYAKERDGSVSSLLEKNNVKLLTFKDQVIFEKEEVVKSDGSPYVVFTPYSRLWLSKLAEFYIKSYPSEKYADRFFRQPENIIPTLQEMGFHQAGYSFPPAVSEESLIRDYQRRRDFPAEKGTSKMGIHLRFGTISIRKLVSRAIPISETYLKELIWREFYQMILWNFPRVGQGRAFKIEYEQIEWRNNENEFDAWRTGFTGYPIVDAGMRELNATGFMHNRVRMIVASFLTKHLLIDWRWGEAYFAEKLLDYDLASNNGGWQWAAGSGCDAAPYFRIFNPSLQAKKFDPESKYIHKWVPELNGFGYLEPIVNHEFARKRCLETFARGLKTM